jgi:hypothetical protein
MPSRILPLRKFVDGSGNELAAVKCGASDQQPYFVTHVINCSAIRFKETTIPVVPDARRQLSEASYPLASWHNIFHTVKVRLANCCRTALRL